MAVYSLGGLMELNQLETFLAVAEERSFSKAAVRLHRTQPAVSQVIRKLEASVGETLFDRAARDGALTAAGVLLRDYALRLLALRTFELGVISFRPDPVQFRTIAVYGDSLALIVNPSHPLARAERVSINDLGNEMFIAHNVASPLRQKVIEAFQRYRTPLNMGIELPTIEAIKRFVAMGNGVALVPHLTVARELETGDLVRVPVDELETRRVLRLVHRRQASLSYAAMAFLRTVRTLAREKGPPFYYQVERTG